MLPRRAIEEAILTWYNEQPRGQNYIQVRRWLLEFDWYHSNWVWHTKLITTQVHACYPIGIATAVTCPSQLLQLLWASTHLLGCASYHCPRLALPEGQRASATYIVCNYDPSYILGEELYESGACSASSCPSSESVCADFSDSSSLTGVFDDDTITGGKLCGEFTHCDVMHCQFSSRTKQDILLKISGIFDQVHLCLKCW